MPQRVADHPLISHEICTPLSVLQGEIEALEDGVRSFSQQSLKEETLGLTRLVADLHLLALSDLHSLPCYFEEVNVLELVRMHYLCLRRGISL